MRVFFLKTKDGRVQVDVNDLEGWAGFEELANLLCRRHGGHVVAKHDGPDARSWVLQIEGQEIVLQHDDMYGHFFFARDSSGDALVKRLGKDLLAAS